MNPTNKKKPTNWFKTSGKENKLQVSGWVSLSGWVSENYAECFPFGSFQSALNIVWIVRWMSDVWINTVATLMPNSVSINVLISRIPNREIISKGIIFVYLWMLPQLHFVPTNDITSDFRNEKRENWIIWRIEHLWILLRSLWFSCNTISITMFITLREYKTIFGTFFHITKQWHRRRRRWRHLFSAYIRFLMKELNVPRINQTSQFIHLCSAHQKPHTKRENISNIKCEMLMCILNFVSNIYPDSIFSTLYIKT